MRRGWIIAPRGLRHQPWCLHQHVDTPRAASGHTRRLAPAPLQVCATVGRRREPVGAAAGPGTRTRHLSPIAPPRPRATLKGRDHPDGCRADRTGCVRGSCGRSVPTPTGRHCEIDRHRLTRVTTCADARTGVTTKGTTHTDGTAIADHMGDAQPLAVTATSGASRGTVTIKADAGTGVTTKGTAGTGIAAMGDQMRDTEPRRSTLTRRKTTSPFTTAAERAQNREKVLRWQHAKRAKGRCRCGAQIAPGSRSRCWECLERTRRQQAADRGRPVRGRRRRGRPMLGSLSVRQRLFEREERRRRRAEARLGWRCRRYRWLS